MTHRSWGFWGIMVLTLMLPSAILGLGGPTSVDATSSTELRVIDPPAAAGSSQPAVASEGATTVRKGHDILLTWLEPTTDGQQLKFARYSDGAWTRPVTIARGVSALTERDWPSLTVFDTQGVRRTLVARSGDLVARSGDAGWTWSRLPADPLPFASFAGGDEGGYAFWIDDDEGEVRLLGTRILAGESVLDPQVATGAATDAAMTWDGPVVVYRDRDSQGASRVSLVRREDARWTRPRPVRVEEWRRRGAPDSGPRVAALQRRLAIAWYTESEDRPRLVVAFSEDGGRTVAPPVEVDADPGAPPWGAVDVSLDDHGNAVVLWLARGDDNGDGNGDEAILQLARVHPQGERGETLVIARGPRQRFAGLPQIARAGTRMAVAWTEVDGTETRADSRVRTVEVPLSAIPELSVAPGRANATPEVSRGTRRPLTRGRVGETLPDFELHDLGGDGVTAKSLAGRAVLLNVWATWCIPCIAEMPELAELHKRFGKEGLVVVGLSVDEEESEDKVHQFVAEHEIPFSVWLDPQMILYRGLRVRSLPASFVLDRTGRILLRRDGTLTADDPELLEALDRALKSPAP